MKEIDWDGSIDPLDWPVEKTECDLTVLAATAVEDLLQERVKECIEDFRGAGIGVWMLTGDKGLTAKEIGVSCGLLPEVSKVQDDDSKNIVVEFKEAYDDEEALLTECEKFVEIVKAYDSYQILIAGKVIAIALDADMQPLATLLLSAESVVVYRSSPLQKAEVVNFMKRYTGGKVTLAIGDGANDVNMIQSADVGFGLMGKEGN